MLLFPFAAELAKQFIPNYADYEQMAGGRRIPVVAFAETTRDPTTG